MLLILAPREFDITLRGNVNFKFVNLYKVAVSSGDALYGRSYAGKGRILNLVLLDKVLTLLKLRSRGRCRVVIPDPKGKVVRQSSLDSLVEYYRGGEVLIVLSPKLSGYDHRLLALHPCELISLGNYVVSSGEVMVRILADSIDRSYEIGKMGGLAKDSMLLKQVPGSRNYSKPRCYKGLAVPEPYFSGNESKLKALQRQEIIIWSQRNDFALFLQILNEYLQS